MAATDRTLLRATSFGAMSVDSGGADFASPRSPPPSASNKLRRAGSAGGGFRPSAGDELKPMARPSTSSGGRRLERNMTSPAVMAPSLRPSTALGTSAGTERKLARANTFAMGDTAATYRGMGMTLATIREGECSGGARPRGVVAARD